MLSQVKQQMGRIMMSDKKTLNAILRNDLGLFIQKIFQTVSQGSVYLHSWHIDAIAYVLTECMNGNIQRLVINLPPRYMKSISVSVAFTAFLLGHKPTSKIICASYTQDLSEKHAADTRMAMESNWYHDVFPHTSLSVKKNTKSEFVTNQNGFRLATSVGGSLTGRGGNFIIIDDPHKADELLSDTKREKVLNWFDQTASTRLDDKKNGAIIVIQQRLHQADLAGYLIDKKHWYHLNLPVIAEKDEKIQIGPNKFHHRKCDEILHPERESMKELDQLKLEMGEYAFAGQYQQRPSPIGGGIVKWSWFKTYYKLKNKMHTAHIIQSWDVATTAEKYSDYTVCITAYAMDHNLYIVDIHRAKYEFPKLRDLIFKMANKYNATDVMIEAAGAGQHLIQQIQEDIKSMQYIPFSLSWSKPKEDKATRLMAEASEIERGRVFLPKSAKWLEVFQTELLNFPNGLHDDQVDSLTLLLQWDRVRYRYKKSSSPFVIYS